MATSVWHACNVDSTTKFRDLWIQKTRPWIQLVAGLISTVPLLQFPQQRLYEKLRLKSYLLPLSRGNPGQLGSAHEGFCCIHRAPIVFIGCVSKSTLTFDGREHCQKNRFAKRKKDNTRMVMMRPVINPEKKRRRSARSSSGKNRSFFFTIVHVTVIFYNNPATCSRITCVHPTVRLQNTKSNNLEVPVGRSTTFLQTMNVTSTFPTVQSTNTQQSLMCSSQLWIPLRMKSWKEVHFEIHKCPNA